MVSSNGLDPTARKWLESADEVALKDTPRKKSYVVARVRQPICWTETRGDWVRVWMEDNGVGIPADQQERAFRVFEPLHGAAYPGTGIGLTMVRKGIERIGGSPQLC